MIVALFTKSMPKKEVNATTATRNKNGIETKNSTQKSAYNGQPSQAKKFTPS
jgi:hypothetical protein